MILNLIIFTFFNFDKDYRKIICMICKIIVKSLKMYYTLIKCFSASFRLTKLLYAIRERAGCVHDVPTDWYKKGSSLFLLCQKNDVCIRRFFKLKMMLYYKYSFIYVTITHLYVHFNK